MRKGVAIPYVIMLILGVAVIGLVGFWFATTGGKFGGQSMKTICDNKFLQYCVKNPGKGYTDFVGAGNSECSGLGSYTTCSEVLGTTPGADAGRGDGQVSLTFGSVCDPKDDKCDVSKKLKCDPTDKECLGNTGYYCLENSDCVDRSCNAPPGGGQAVC